MKSKSKLNFGRVNTATIARIKDLRTTLEFFKLNPNTSAYDLHDNYLQWSASKCTKMIRNLVTCELVRVAGTSRGKAPKNLYSVVLRVTQEDIDRELPLEMELSRTSGRTSDEKPPVRVVSDWIPGEAKRDPLTVALMGSGVAPSLTFSQRYSAYERLGVNFMDSAKGG